MADVLAGSYLWIKAFHIISVITWMAGLFYLPRLFVYHTEQAVVGDSRDAVFQIMEYKLFRYIMNPSMISAWLFGGLLVMTPGIVDWGSAWPYAKMAGILVMTWLHHWLGVRRKAFLTGSNNLTGRHYRLMNEVPTLAMILIVISVVVKF